MFQREVSVSGRGQPSGKSPVRKDTRADHGNLEGKAWGEVARLVSAVGVGRSADDAKKKWSSMKSDTKQ